MNEIVHIASGRNLFTGLLLVAAVVMIFLAPKAAVNVDEQLHYPHAKKVVNWYFTGGKDQSCLHTPVTNLKYYGQSVDNITALINRIFKVENEFLIRHYTGAFFFLMLLLFAGLLSHEVSGSWVAASVTVLALICMPRLSGQAFGNLKDIPFAAGYLAGILILIRFFREFPHVKWSTALLLGLAIAFTVSVRAGGFILFAYLGLGVLVYFALKPFYFVQIVPTKLVFVRLLGQASVILITGYFLGLLFWPFALQNIFRNPVESLQVMEHYKVSIRQIFEGKMYWSTGLPWYYLPKWLLISTPLIILAGAGIFLLHWLYHVVVKLNFSRQHVLEGFVLFAFIFPFAYVIAIRSNMYSGIRQMLFILPPLTVLSLHGFFLLLRKLNARSKPAYRIAVVLLTGVILWPVKHQAATFPVDYVYFNILAGGNKKAWSNYEYDYYFHGVKQAAEYLAEITGGKEVTVAMNCNLSNYTDNIPGADYQYVRFLERSSADWDFGIFGLNYIDPYLLKNDLWMPSGVVKVFYNKGNPVAVVVKRDDKSDYYGISEINNGNLHQGVEYLEMAVESQPTNVWLYVNLAKAKLELGLKEEFEAMIAAGKMIHPTFEPLLLLEATAFYREGNYEQANKSLLRLLNNNPRYLPAGSLLQELKVTMNNK